LHHHCASARDHSPESPEFLADLGDDLRGVPHLVRPPCAFPRAAQELGDHLPMRSGSPLRHKAAGGTYAGSLRSTTHRQTAFSNSWGRLNQKVPRQLSGRAGTAHEG
jgi:hypothetical protein